jgi:hypothetical protein
MSAHLSLTLLVVGKVLVEGEVFSERKEPGLAFDERRRRRRMGCWASSDERVELDHSWPAGQPQQR